MTQEKNEPIDRRRFLKTSSALSAGLAFGATSCGSGGTKEEKEPAKPPAPETGAPPPKPQPNSSSGVKDPAPEVDGAPAVVPADALVDAVRVAVIGSGTQGRALITSALKACSPGILFTAVCDIWPFNRQYGTGILRKMQKDVPCGAYEDYREMLVREKDLQAVIVATPDWMHAEHAIACMKAGLHVYCEKEMSNDLNKAREMVNVSRETGKLLQIGHQRRSSPRYLFAKDLLDRTKLLGVMTHAYGQWNRTVVNSASLGAAKDNAPPLDLLQKYGYGSLEEFRDWRWYRKYGGGPICDLGSHQIDVLAWFIGAMPKKVIVSGGRDYWVAHKKASYEWYDNVRAIYDFPTENGTVRALYQVLTTTGSMGYFESFMGTEGTLSLSENPARCRAFAEGYLSKQSKSGHPWDEWVREKLLIKKDEPAPPPEDKALSAGGLSEILDLWKASPPPDQYLFNLNEQEKTLHGAHLRNFLNAVRGKEKLNCPGEVGYECAVQVLKVNQLLDAGKDSGTFEENDFKV